MANLGGQFLGRNVAPDEGRDPIPAGDYLAMIVDSDMKSTKDGRGQYLELVHQIVDGPFKGRKVWARLNLVNANQQTATIAQAQLSSITHALGLQDTPISDSQQLHNRPLVIRVSYEKADGQRRTSDSNDVKGWKSPSATAAPTAGVGAGTVGMPPQSAPAPAAGPAPWMRGKAA